VRIGIFGGTFDPPHIGHLIAAADAADALSLDQILFIPAAAQPLKVGRAVASPDQRLAMTTLMAGDDPRLAVDAIEIERAGLSYTVETVAELTRRSPGHEWYVIVGADVVQSFGRWRDPLGILKMAGLVILRRGDIDPGSLAGWMPRDEAGRLPAYQILASRRVDVTSTEVRARVSAGRSIRGFVPEAVQSYIERGGLYRNGNGFGNGFGEGDAQYADQ
jgi:nicotinate-nucleotide adenylyltransferase